jgi:transcriptional regulator with XRE-family HTH domain
MNIEQLHKQLSADPDYSLAYAEEDLIHRVALRVLEFREASGLSQRELAELLGTKQPAVARIEAGDANLTLRKVAQIAYVLGYDAESLVVRDCPEPVTLEWDYNLADEIEFSTMVYEGANFCAAHNDLAEAA